MTGRALVRAVGDEVGLTQTMVSRIDNGKTVPSMPVVRAWLDATAADPPTRRRVLALAESVHGETASWRVLHSTAPHQQQQQGLRDQQAVLIRNFQPTVIPGLLQTARYAESVISIGRSPDKPGAVAGRLARQALLDEPGRRFEFIIGEHALRWSPTPAALHGQADLLVDRMALAAVDVRVLPITASAGVTPWNNFILRTDSDGVVTAASETMLGEQGAITAVADVAVLEEAWAKLWRAALSRADAVAFIRSLA